MVYRSESGVPVLGRTSRRLELATRLVINQFKYDSENYQIMNYGLGGAILVHKDVDDPKLVDETFSVSLIKFKRESHNLDIRIIWRTVDLG